MLILSRKRGESIIIDGGAIKITLLMAEDGTARIGVDAPRDIEVYREEVFERIQRGDVRKSPTTFSA